nr:transposase [uncultured Rhodopila sp.]
MDATPILVPEADPAEDARTIGRKGARTPQVEVITRGERRRAWTLEQKQEIVAESLGSTLTPTEVARKHGISSGLLYGWRQKLIGGRMTLLLQSPPGFARVEIAPTQSDKHDPEPATPTVALTVPVRTEAASRRARSTKSTSQPSQPWGPPIAV